MVRDRSIIYKAVIQLHEIQVHIYYTYGLSATAQKILYYSYRCCTFFFLIIHCYPHATVGHWRAILFHFTFVCVCALCVLYCVLCCVVCEKIQCNLFINFKHKILFWLDLLLKKYSIQHVAMEKINKNVNIKITGKKNNHKCHNTLEK